MGYWDTQQRIIDGFSVTPQAIAIFSSAARSIDTTSSTINVLGGNYARFFLDVTSVVAASTCNVGIVTLDPVSGKSLTLATFPTVTSTGFSSTTATYIGNRVQGTIDFLAGTITLSLGAVFTG